MRKVLAVIIVVLTGCGGASTDTTLASDLGATTVTDNVAPTSTAAVSTSSTAATASATSTTAGPVDSADLFPDVIAVQWSSNADGTYRFDVTISSPYDSNEQYADAWRVIGTDGTEYGVRVLTHPHANEQPFTRSLDGVEIPDDVTEVIVEGRDLLNGWGGATLTVTLP